MIIDLKSRTDISCQNCGNSRQTAITQDGCEIKNLHVILLGYLKKKNRDLIQMCLEISKWNIKSHFSLSKLI